MGDRRSQQMGAGLSSQARQTRGLPASRAGGSPDRCLRRQAGRAWQNTAPTSDAPAGRPVTAVIPHIAAGSRPYFHGVQAIVENGIPCQRVPERRGATGCHGGGVLGGVEDAAPYPFRRPEGLTAAVGTFCRHLKKYCRASLQTIGGNVSQRSPVRRRSGARQSERKIIAEHRPSQRTVCRNFSAYLKWNTRRRRHEAAAESCFPYAHAGNATDHAPLGRPSTENDGVHGQWDRQPSCIRLHRYRQAFTRFEKDACNDMWQTDLKFGWRMETAIRSPFWTTTPVSLNCATREKGNSRVSRFSGRTAKVDSF